MSNYWFESFGSSVVNRIQGETNRCALILSLIVCSNSKNYCILSINFLSVMIDFFLNHFREQELYPHNGIVGAREKEQKKVSIVQTSNLIIKVGSALSCYHMVQKNVPIILWFLIWWMRIQSFFLFSILLLGIFFRFRWIKKTFTACNHFL